MCPEDKKGIVWNEKKRPWRKFVEKFLICIPKTLKNNLLTTRQVEILLTQFKFYWISEVEGQTVKRNRMDIRSKTKKDMCIYTWPTTVPRSQATYKCTHTYKHTHTYSHRFRRVLPAQPANCTRLQGMQSTCTSVVCTYCWPRRPSTLWILREHELRLDPPSRPTTGMLRAAIDREMLGARTTTSV